MAKSSSQNVERKQPMANLSGSLVVIEEIPVKYVRHKQDRCLGDQVLVPDLPERK